MIMFDELEEMNEERLERLAESCIRRHRLSELKNVRFIGGRIHPRDLGPVLEWPSTPKQTRPSLRGPKR